MSEVTKVRERPIFFSAPMIRAILEGRKTQTRRVIKPTKRNADGIITVQFDDEPIAPHCFYNMFGDSNIDDEGMEWPIECRYGEVGDILWVRETWQQSRPRRSNGQRFCVRYPAKGIGDIHYAATHNEDEPPKWRPSIHMPRWASRINLEITEVRCEPLQDISEEDAIAECVFVQTGDGGKPGAGYKWRGPGYWDGFSRDEYGGMTFHVAESDGACMCNVGRAEKLTPAKCAFRHVWNKINGAGSWESNPYVWAIAFKVSPAPSDGAEAAQ